MTDQKTPPCEMCGKERTDEHDYSPMQLLIPGTSVGWYNEPGEGSLCPEDMVKLFKGANGL